MDSMTHTIEIRYCGMVVGTWNVEKKKYRLAGAEKYVMFMNWKTYCKLLPYAKPLSPDSEVLRPCQALFMCFHLTNYTAI